MYPTGRVKKYFKTTLNEFSNDIQVDRLCTGGSLVINVYSLWNYWYLKNRVFLLFRC